MSFDPEYLLDLPPRIIRSRHDARDVMLYALGVGAGQDPDPTPDLPFIYENGLKVLPTMAAVLTYPGYWQSEPSYGIDWKRNLHAEQSIEFHEELPVAGNLRGEMTIDWIADKGAEKGALLSASRRIFDEEDGRLLATVRQTSFLRGDGGHGGSVDKAPLPHPVPNREPDHRHAMTTRVEQAYVYRLSGDYNPLHADPETARDGGWARPILHGLCTYGVAGRAILRSLCENRPELLKRLNCRFSAPVFPGETISVAVWRESPGRAAFQAHALERDIVVLNNGYVEFEEV